MKSEKKITQAYIVIVESSEDTQVPVAFSTKKERDGFIKKAKADNQVFSFTVNKVDLDVTAYACNDCGEFDV